MFAYTIRRVIGGILLLVVMSVVTFYLFYASSSTPERFACGPKCTPAQLELTKQALGYDEPTIVQWGKFAKGFVNGREFPDDPALRAAAPEQVVECPPGCLGYSTGYSMPVNDLIKDKLPVSVSLAIAAFCLWIFGGILLGIVAALFKGRLLDKSIVGLVPDGLRVPDVLHRLAPAEVRLHPLGARSPCRSTRHSRKTPWLWATGMILPAITLALVYMAGYIRMTRAFVLETMSEDYIRTARAKGLTRRVVIGKHTLRAVLTPLVTMAGLDLAGLLGGAIITESVFNFNGVGKLSITAVQRYDLPLIVGIVLLLASFVIVANIVVDLLYAVIDPRVRLG